MLSLPTSTAELTERRDHLRLRQEVIALEAADHAYESMAQEIARERNTVRRDTYESCALPDSFVDPNAWRQHSLTGSQLFYQEDDRRDGQFEPFIRTVQDANDYTKMARIIGETNPWIRGLRDDLANYTVGQGAVLKVSTDSDASEQLVARVERFLDALLDENKWHGIRDREMFDRWRFDGRSFLQLLPDKSDPIPRLRFLEPSWVCDPGGNLFAIEEYLSGEHPDIPFDLSSWSFGIHTTDGDHERHHGYFIDRDPGTASWEYVPASHCEYLKANTPLSVKPGLTDLFCVAPFANKSLRLFRALMASSTEQARLMGIITYEDGATALGVETMLAQTVTRSSSQYTNHTQDGDDAYLKHFPKNRVWNYGPLGQSAAPVFLQVHEAALRSLGVRWSAPEFLISSDASNANYASTLVSQSPFVKHVQNAQHVHSAHAVRMCWKAVRIAFDAGYFNGLVSSYAELRRGVNLEMVPPDVASDDAQARLDETTRRLELMAAGAMSKPTLQQEEGLDPDDEQQAGAAPAVQPALDPQAQQLKAATESAVVALLNKHCAMFANYPNTFEDCGTGAGGFKGGNVCAKGGGGGGGKLSTHHRNAIADYTTDKFQQVNGELRSGTVSKDTQRLTADLDAALSSAPKYDRPTVRSFSLPEGEEGQRIRSMLTQGGTFSDAAYLSSRKSPSITDRAAFQNKTAAAGQVVLRIQGRSGVDISDISMNPGEGEVLFPRGTEFQVSKVVTLDNGAILAELEERE